MAAAATLAVLGCGAVLTANPASAGLGLQGSSPRIIDGPAGKQVVTSRGGARPAALDAAAAKAKPATPAPDKATKQATTAQKKGKQTAEKKAKQAAAKAAREALAKRPVAGIPQPCAARHPWPADATPAQRKAELARFTGLRLQGPGWDDPRYTPQVKIVWQTLDALGCTDYLATVKKHNKGFGLHAGSTRSWAWGDWGLTHPGLVTLDFAKFDEALTAGDEGRIVRIIVHEIGHAWSQTPAAQSSYNGFGPLYRASGNFGPYAYNHNENFSEVIGYYVARCVNGNPYDSGRYSSYYEHVKTTVFKGREFGPKPGKLPSCTEK